MSRSGATHNVRQMFIDLGGLTLTEANREFRRRYPNAVREASTYICGQKSWGNYKVIGRRNNEDVYMIHIPTKEEKLLTKIEACKQRQAESQAVQRKLEQKLEKLRAKLGSSLNTESLYDHFPDNTLD